MRNLLFFCIITCLATSCSEDFFEQTIDIDPPVYTKQLVAHTLVTNLDSLFSLPLTRNFGILDQTSDSTWAVKNALVEIYEDGQLKLVVPPASSLEEGYVAPLPPDFFQAGKSYELRAQHPDFTGILARQVMPAAVQIDSVAYRQNGGISTDGSELSAFDVYLQDPPGVRNYYVVWVSGYYPQIESIYDNFGNLIRFDTIGYYDYSLYPESPEDANVRLAAGNTMAVSDQFFDGQAYKFVYRTYHLEGPGYYQVHIRAVTEDYFLYVVSAQRKADAEDLPLVEPVTVHDNVDNGIGIFGLGWEKVVKIEQ